MDYRVERAGNKSTLYMEGQITASDRKNLDLILREVFVSGVDEVVIDMTELAYIDSIGLGLLIVIRDQAETTSCKVCIVGMQGKVKEILEMASIDRLFEIK